MKSYRVVALLLTVIMIFAMVGCNHNGHGGSDDPHGNAHNQQNQQNQQIPNTNTTPEQNNGGNVGSENGTPDSGENEEIIGGAEGKVTYVYSVLSKVIHLPECYHIGRINDLYKKEFTGDINELLADEDFTICKDCLVPDEDTGDEDEDDSEDDGNKISKEEATYAINKSSGVIHTLDCYHLEIIVEKNLEYTDLTIEQLLLEEHRPCGSCLPDDYEEYKKNHPEEFEK